MPSSMPSLYNFVRIAGAGRGRESAGAATLAATCALGIGPVIAALIAAPTETIIALRFVLAAPIFLVLLRSTRLRLTRRHLWACLPGGILLPVQVGLFFAAARTTSVADATFLMSLQPVLMLVLAGSLLKERVSTTTKLCAVGGVAGIGLVVSGSAMSGTFRLEGGLLGFGSLLTWTAYLIVSKRARADDDAPAALQYQAGVNLIGAGIWAVAIMVFRIPVVVSASALAGIGYLTLVTGVIGHGLITWSQRHLDQSVISTILLMQPVVSALGGAFVLGQPLTLWSGLGAVLVVGSGVVALKQARTTTGDRR